MGCSNLMEYSPVKDVDDIDERPPSPDASTPWKPVFLVTLYAILTSVLTSLTVWTFRPIPCSGGSRLLRTPVPESSKVPKEIRVFRQNNTFTEPPTPDNDRAWNELLPAGRGFVYVEDGARYGLEPGIATDKGEIYSVSLYHSIHCLGLVRRNYWRLIHAVLGHTTEMVEFARKEMNDSHTAHCFDYFRQSFECSADMSLEWPLTSASGKRIQVDGEGIPHVCTSKQALKEYMEENHFTGARNHDISA
ncbi:hypothetical protein L249_8425 [Ophiocordyceps polyrhachis-furcata BCC 54312]|uniref:Uncharacterized protein n=1 Tax=Ophiocordyceps polyrhachis-furcata BCC 54312 TaxID=1330021 RepID=A0A367L6C0_9HYPO|nr:hypothetical protein L249_8425 [Ophiocordyceps polyrhachis-furcata BCC 54312]